MTTSVEAIAKYKWSIDADSVANTANLNYDYRKPGNHIVKLDIETINGCTFSITKNIVIDSIVTNFTLSPVRFCGSGTVSFTNLTSNFAAIDFYNWRFGDGNTSTAVNPTHTYLSSGFYTVQLVGATVNGCRDTTNFVDTLKVYNFPTANITGDSIHCAPGFYTYKSVINSIDQIQSYQWFIDGIQRTTMVDLNSNIFAGNYIISLKIATVNGCTDSVSKIIIVDSIQSLFSISKQKFCGDSATVLFTNNAVSRFNIVRHEWDFGDNSSSTLNNPIHTYLQAGVYDVKLIVTSEHGCTDTLMQTRAIEIYKNPVPSIGGDSIQCFPGKNTYFSTATSVDSIAQYQWLVNGLVAGNTDTLK